MEYYHRNADALDAEHANDKNAEEESGSNNNIYTLRKGRTVIRVLPPYSAEGLWFRKITEYYFRLGDGHLFLTSPRDFDLPDPLWDWGESIYEKGNEEAIKEANNFRPKPRSLMNVLILSDPKDGCLEDGIKVLKAPTTVRRALVDFDCDREYGDITNPEAGFNMMIDREGEKLNTKYIVKAQRERSNIFQTLMDKGIDPNGLTLPNLEEVHKGGLKSAAELEAVLEQLRGRVAPKAQAPKQSFAQAAAPAAVTVQPAASPVETAPQAEAQPSGPISSPVMVAPEGQTVPAGVVIPQPPTQGGE